ncbi:ubiquinol oxidase subunit II [Pseudomonas sp. AFG_SD02_1510_Pfu_092]|uniref:ubiquinol oxidase subunit II n=1 Tax=Pseudomonas sp. AFG_SD02_1510_Pfu_092 TaxID=2259497 RepID=UPI000DEEB6E8|nr:ubiquinol oxidase subunit II [Pseudomonas sp. AFG_SD02_1510_Pfu_092]RCL28504.1 ubiquinol oxidase subunit II [Pseudomonas sp. AFG_SD02_1510_Pfu_092]
MAKGYAQAARLVGLLVLGAVALQLAGCDMVLFNPKGQVGLEQRNLIILATLLMLIVVIPVMVLALVFSVHYRASNLKARYTPEWSHSRVIECVVWGVPLVIIIVLGIVTWRSTHALDPYRPLQSDARPIQVQVIAIDWKWLFIYPELGIASVNELAMPVDTPVDFRVTADGAITSFFIPALGGQIYAMAGMQTQLHLIANHRGSYTGIAANYNGPGFSDMHFKALALDQAGFDAWVAKVRSSQRQLDQASYTQLARPSVAHPVEHYAAVDAQLFQKLIDKYQGVNRSREVERRLGDPQAAAQQPGKE